MSRKSDKSFFQTQMNLYNGDMSQLVYLDSIYSEILRM